MTYTILIVDDDPNQQRIAEHILRDKMEYNTIVVGGGKEAIDILSSERAHTIDLVLLDLSMPQVSGMDVLRAVKPLKRTPPIIVRTAHDDVDLAVEAMKAGAVDFVTKQDGIQKLQTSIHNALRLYAVSDELLRLKRSIGAQVTFSNVIGESAMINETIALGRKAGRSNIPVCIQGESGVGKELLAHAIHSDSDRATKPFVAVNCGAIPENLVESILFGHEKGAFTGAIEKSIGKFREAEGGTLFLDEVGELSPNIQVKLLRALQEGEVESVGGKQPVKVDIRVMSATNKDLAERVRRGEFREDLYYRLHVFPIVIPPLRERKEDIPLMIDYFCKRFAAEEEKPITYVTDRARQVLINYQWPGNIRELKNVIFRAVVLSDNDHLDVADFPHIVHQLEVSQHRQTAQQIATYTRSSDTEEAAISTVDASGHFMTLGKMEEEVIRSAMKFYNGRISEVARRLGIGRSTLYRKLTEMGLHEYRQGEDDKDE